MARTRPAAEAPEPSGQEDSARKAELLERLIEYSVAHGLSDVSLRPLAAAVGSSPRVLLYFFGSKERLIREVLIRSRSNQMRLMEEWLHDADTPSERIERLWEWLANPHNAGIERLFFEAYVRSLHDADDAWADFGKKSVQDWLPVIDEVLGVAARGKAFGGTRRGLATFVLGTLRGLLIDLLATGERSRVERGFTELIEHLRSLEIEQR